MEKSEINAIAREMAADTSARLVACGDDAARQGVILKDLKLKVAEKAARLSGYQTEAQDAMGEVLAIARQLPDFQGDMAGERRMSAISLASAVVLGWLLGGLLSGVLNLLDMGGDILRAGTIFCSVWLSDYLASNPAARKKALKILGWASLGGIAARIAGGVLRFGTGWRNLLLGGARPGFFRSIWLLIGIGAIFVFFSGRKNQAGQVFPENLLSRQVEEKLEFLVLVFSRLAESQAELRRVVQASASNGDKAASQAALLDAMLQVRESLPEASQKFLSQKLENAGIRQEGAESNYFTWDDERDAKLYEPLGIISQGDKCIIIRRPASMDGKIIKGVAQRWEQGGA